MSKHRYYEMIVAKAADMELVVFEKRGVATHENDKFIEINPQGNKAIWFDECCEYFLCLPQHKKECLHWLNGGEVQDFFEGEFVDCISLSEAIITGNDNGLEFSYHHVFMNEEFDFRIKPKKVKKWIIVDTKNEYTINWLFETKEAAEKENGGVHQVIEIEVEE